MQKVYLALGSNLNDPIYQVEKATLLIQQLPYVTGFISSSLYTTQPLNVDGPLFVNSVVCFDKPANGWSQCLLDLQDIERKMGKIPKPKNSSRIIDIDILFWSDMSISDTITVPHPSWKERLFVLEPLSELTNKIVLPTQEAVSVKTLIHELKIKGVAAGEVIERLQKIKRV